MYMNNDQIDELRELRQITTLNNEKAKLVGGACTFQDRCIHEKCTSEKCQHFYLRSKE